MGKVDRMLGYIDGLSCFGWNIQGSRPDGRGQELGRLQLRCL